MVGNERGDRDVRGSIASRHGGSKKPVLGQNKKARTKVECDPPKRNIGRRETLVPPVKLGGSQNSSSARRVKALKASGNTTRHGCKYVNVWVADIGRPYHGRWARFTARRKGTSGVLSQKETVIAPDARSGGEKAKRCVGYSSLQL